MGACESTGSARTPDLTARSTWSGSRRSRKPVLVGPVALRVRDLIRQIALERELQILAGKVARDHVHLFLSYRPHQDVSTIVQWLKGTTARILLQECAHLRKQFWGRHLWARGYFGVTSGNITDAMIHEYIAEQEGEPVQDDSRFQIDDSPNLPPSRR